MSYLRFCLANGRWLGAGFALCFFSSFGQTFFISLSNGEIRSEFGLSNGSFGLLYMAATLASAATLPALGGLLDRHPAWKIAAANILALAAATAAMAFSTAIPFLVLTLYLLRLFGQGMMTEIALTATGRWFAANRGRAMALVTLGLHAGTGALPFAYVMAAESLGWRGAWIVAALVLLVLALPLSVLPMMRERNPRSDPVPAAKSEVRDWTRGEVLRSAGFWLILMAVLAPPFIGTTLFFHQVYLTELRGWSLGAFAAGFALMSATTVLVSIACGSLIDRFSALRLLPAFLLPMAASCFVAAFAAGEWSIPVFMILLGISNGASSTLLGALWPELNGTKHLGAIRSVTVAQMVLASALGPGVTGVLIDLDVSYPMQIAAMGGYCLIMSAAMGIFVATLSRRRLRAARFEAIGPQPGPAFERIDPEPRRP